MNGLETAFTDESFYWILGAIGLVFLFVLLFIISRIRRGRGGKTTITVSPRRPPSPSESSVLQAAPATEPAPISIEEPSGDLEIERIPESDLPADLAARPMGGLPEDQEAVPHRPEEIQKPAPKPLFSALSNTRSSFFGRFKNMFGSRPAISENEMEEIEEILYTSDLGPQTVQRLLDAVETRVREEGSTGFDSLRMALKNEMLEIFSDVESGVGDGAQESRLEEVAGSDEHAKGHLRLVKPGEDAPTVHHGSEEYLEGLEHLAIWDHKPAVILVVGVNGAGKTTTIGKLARRLAQSGRKVLVAAGDTFRAAAGDQLKIWTERAQVEIFSPEGVTDPSAVAFMASEAAQKKAFDIVIIDTAGRLHTQKNLMEELKKMKRVIGKQIDGAPHEVLLVLDANSGQNALIQAREFHSALDVTGVVLTKLDGSAKGGVAVGLACELRLPIKLIGVGEGIDDLRRFSSREFVDSII